MITWLQIYLMVQSPRRDKNWRLMIKKETSEKNHKNQNNK